MTTITLDLPERLVRRLDAERDRLPLVVEQALNLLPPRHNAPSTKHTTGLAFGEMIEFLSSRPTSQQTLDFRISPRAQARLSELLDKNREEGLTETENAELDWYEQVHEIMTRMKAQAQRFPAE